MKHIAVLGANGQLGNAVMQAFHQAGYQVTAVTRNGHVRGAPAPVKRVAADAMNLKQLKKAVRGAGFVFNGLNPPYTHWVHVAIPMARNVIEAVRSTGAVHLFPGNVYNYGKQIPLRCDINTPMVADSVKSRIRIETEKMFALAAQKYKLKTLIIRSGDVYGARGSWFDLALMDKLQKNQFVYPGPMGVVHTWAYLPDLAQAFVAVANNHRQCGLFENLLYSGHSLTGNELKTLAEQVCGRELMLLGMPWKLIKLGSIIVPMWREMADREYLWSRPHYLVDDRIKQIAGTLEETPPEIAMRNALQILGKV